MECKQTSQQVDKVLLMINAEGTSKVHGWFDHTRTGEEDIHERVLQHLQ